MHGDDLLLRWEVYCSRIARSSKISRRGGGRRLGRLVRAVEVVIAVCTVVTVQMCISRVLVAAVQAHGMVGSSASGRA